MNVHDFYIIHNIGIQLFRQPFTLQNTKPHLLSSFMTALSSFANEVLPNIDKYSDEYLRTIDRGNFKLLVEKGKHVVGVIIAEEDDTTIREKLRILVDLFEQKYKKILEDGKYNKVSQFNEFSNEVLKKFPKRNIYPSHVPILLKDKSDKISEEEKLFILFLKNNGGLTISEIADKLNMSVNDVIELVSLLDWKNYIDLKELLILKDESIFKLNEKVVNSENYSIIQERIKSLYGSSGIKIFQKINGKNSLIQISKRLNIDINIVKRIINYFYANNWIKLIGVKLPGKDELELSLEYFIFKLGFDFIVKLKHICMCQNNVLEHIEDIAKSQAIEICNEIPYLGDIKPTLKEISDNIIEIIKMLYIKFDPNQDNISFNIDYKNDKFHIFIKKCFECENIYSNRSICSYTTGLIKGLLNYYTTKFDFDYIVKEEMCISKGDPFCKWEIKLINLEKADVSVDGKSKFLARLIKKDTRKKLNVFITAYSVSEAKEYIKARYPNYKLIELLKY